MCYLLRDEANMMPVEVEAADAMTRLQSVSRYHKACASLMKISGSR
jgi:hypothetical protein